jgi:predicted RNA binding protein YcfA (HicA-like mRNA interferase family)
LKRRDLIRHLEQHGCRLRREGGGHSIYWNPANGRTAAVPRHSEINTFTARGICAGLGVPPPPFN